MLPTGIRHLFFLLRILPRLFLTDIVIALDTFSVGLPSVIAASLLGKFSVLRIGGDFLWETYEERTKKPIFLSEFYRTPKILSLKEKTIFSLSGWAMRHASSLVFTTNWLKEIFKKAYSLNPERLSIINNYFEPLLIENGNQLNDKEKFFISSARNIFIKNKDKVSTAFNLAQKKDPTIKLVDKQMDFDSFQEAIASSYAIIVASVSEVSPNLILEAIQRGKPFIVTKDIGMKDILGDIAVFVDPLSVNDIGQKVLFLADKQNYAKQTAKIRNWDFHHSWDEIATEFISVYEKYDTRRKGR